LLEDQSTHVPGVPSKEKRKSSPAELHQLIKTTTQKIMTDDHHATGTTRFTADCAYAGYDYDPSAKTITLLGNCLETNRVANCIQFGLAVAFERGDAAWALGPTPVPTASLPPRNTINTRAPQRVKSSKIDV